MEWQTEDALLIPLSAAFRRGEEWQVFTVDDTMRARERPVMLGRHDGRMAIVLDGLAAGERVVTHPLPMRCMTAPGCGRGASADAATEAPA